MRHLIKYLLISTHLLGTGVPAFAQSSFTNDISSFARHPLKIYTNKDGLPQSAIISSAVDSIGRLWIGTQDGAAFYNGRKWEIVNMPQQTASNYIQTIKVNSDGAVLFGVLRSGLYRYHTGKWEFFGVKDGLPSDFVLSLHEQVNYDDKGKVLWVGTNRGVASYNNGIWKTFSNENEPSLAGNVIYDIYETKDGTLWFATNNGVSKYLNNKWEIITMPDGLGNKQIYRIFNSHDGAMWFGSDGIVGRLKNDKWRLIYFKGSKSSNVVNAIYQSTDKSIWFGTHSGLWRIKHSALNSENNKLEFVNFRGTSEHNELIVWNITETKGGELWFGTFLGLFRYKEGKWKGITTLMDAERGGTTSIYSSPNGNFLFGTESGLVRFQNGKWAVDDKIRGSILDIYQSKDNAIWISVLFDGIYKFENNKLKKFTKSDGLAENSNWFISQSIDGTMWFGSDKGLTKFLNNKRFFTFTTKDGLTDNTVLCMCESFDSTLYFGTTKGITVYKKEKWGKFEIKNYNLDLAVSDLFEYLDSSLVPQGLWIATLGGGILNYDYKLKDIKTFNTFSTPAISNNSVYKIEKDFLGRLYFLTNHGVTRFTFHQNDSIQTEIFTNEDGLPNNEGISGASFVDHQGRIWFGTTEGAAFFDPRTEIADKTPKPLVLERIMIKDFYDNKVIKSGIELTYKQNTISFEFALLCFFKENENKFSYKLVGYENDKSVWATDFKKEYSNLSDGKYTFLLWGKDYNGNISGPIEFSFTILAPWWETWWFRSVFIMLLGLFVFLSIKIYTTKKVKKRLAKLERKNLIERERTRISQDMHDTIGSDLTKIAILSDRIENELRTFNEDVRLDGIKKRITSIGEISREIIDSMNEIIWSLSPQYDSLSNLIFYMHHYANEMLAHHSTSLEFKLPEKIPDIILTPEIRRNIFLIFKEAVNNLVKYSEATFVKINLNISNTNFQFEIFDNGIGFLELQDDVMQDKLPKFGIQNMKQRAKSIGAELEINSTIGKGTTVKFIFSLESIK